MAGITHADALGGQISPPATTLLSWLGVFARSVPSRSSLNTVYMWCDYATTSAANDGDSSMTR